MAENALEHFIKQYINEHGPINMATFMEMALAHPVHGYYRTKDPFGVTGDFITAPEISQLFGEMIGIYFYNFYKNLPDGQKIYLVECGAGRGTMMRDILRVLKNKVPCDVHIVELSQKLRAIQQATIGNDCPIIFHDTIETLPQDFPMLIVGNEFLDAIPTRQAIAIGGAWYEHGVGIVNGNLSFVVGAKLSAANLPPLKNNNQIFEFSPAREGIHETLCDRILKQKGLLLWIDYGFDRGGNTGSVQAVRDHKYTNILHDIGCADISSLVDFEVLKNKTPPILNVDGVATQSDFLKACGIELRKDILIQKNPDHAQTILSGYHRLIDADQMGTLFKVLGVSHY